MANPICLSPLKFYDSLAKQNHRKSYAYGHISPLIMPLNTLDPFQFILEDEQSYIEKAYLCHETQDGKTVYFSIIEALLRAGLKYIVSNGYKAIIFPGVFSLLDIEDEGYYYLQLETNNKKSYYSEVFCFTNNTYDCLTIEYWNPESDFIIKHGVISFADNFRFKIRLRSELGKPEYNFEEEATKRLGYSFIESQVSSKTYKFNAVLPEYICDALRLIRLCSNKVLKSKDETYDMITFDMNVEWQEQGDLASVTCEFQVDNIIANIGGYSAHLLGGDYNNDFNNDFDKQ